MLVCFNFRRHSLQFPEGVLNKHYEKLVQCDPRLKALVEGTLVVGPSLPCDQTDSMFEGWSALHLSKTLSPLTHAFEGLSYQPQMLLSHYSSLQHRHKMTGLIPEPQADSSSVDVQMSNMSSPSYGTVSGLIMVACRISFWLFGQRLLFCFWFFMIFVLYGGWL